MITIGEIARNISAGQQSLKLRYVIQGLDAYYKKVATKIKIRWAKEELNGTTVYFHIPSEDKNSVFYDVVIWFDTKERPGMSTAIKVYSNSPGFAYNFANVFFREGSLLFPSHYDKIFLKENPKVRNPLETKAFDKQVYAALKHLNRFSLSDLVDASKGYPEPKVKTFKQKTSELGDYRERQIQMKK